MTEKQADRSIDKHASCEKIFILEDCLEVTLANYSVREINLLGKYASWEGIHSFISYRFVESIFDDNPSL